MNFHIKNCDCLECTKDQVFSMHVNKALSPWNNSNNIEGKADEFIGGTLVALKDTNIYSSPDGRIVKSVKVGNKVGVIYSYIVSSGNVWWQIDYGNKQTGFVKQVTGQFDDIALKNSLAKLQAEKNEAINDAANKRKEANENPLYKTGKFLEDFISFDTLNKIIVGIIVLIIGSILLRIFK